MKVLLTLLTLIIATTVKAEIPDYLKDGIITVTLKDGSSYTFSSNEYKVVKRGQVQLVAPDMVLAQPSAPEAKEKSKNSIIFHAGMGKDGLSTRSDGAKHEVKEQYEPVGGITYCRDADERLAVCGTGMTNNTFTFGIKLDF